MLKFQTELSLLACFEAQAKLHPLAINCFCQSATHGSFLARCTAKTELHPLTAKKSKRWTQLFTKVLHRALSWPVAKPRPSYTHWQSKYENTATTFCQSVARSSFLAHCEALSKLQPLAIKGKKWPHLFAKVLHGARSWPAAKPWSSCIHW